MMGYSVFGELEKLMKDKRNGKSTLPYRSNIIFNNFIFKVTLRSTNELRIKMSTMG